MDSNQEPDPTSPSDGELPSPAAGLHSMVHRMLEQPLGSIDALRLFAEAPTLIDESSSTPGSPAPGSPFGEHPGQVIGNFTLIRPIGEGGFGTVWRARQTKPVDREVALKIIKVGMDSREVVARFEQERQAVAMMDHPHVAKVFDAGTMPSGRPYFVMEWVNGEPITAFCDKRRMKIPDRLHLFMDVCRAVQHAHQKGVIHRDLKPSNILVTVVDGRPMPKLIDFGVAKALDVPLTEDTMRALHDETTDTGFRALHGAQGSLVLNTQHGQIIGTPEYMSPEQAEADPRAIDTRTDIFALGVILYELLTGTTPLDSRTLRQARVEFMCRLISSLEAERPSQRAATRAVKDAAIARARQTTASSLQRHLTGDVDWIVLRALEKDRERRYGSAAALTADLQRHLDNEPVEAGPPSALYRFGKFARRNRLALASAASIVVLLVAGITVSTWQAVRATKAEKLAEATAIRAQENLSHSDFLQALRSIDEDKSADALAQLRRSLSENPQNDAALCRLATLLTHHDFLLPLTRLKGYESLDAAMFSPDGKAIFTVWENAVRVWDAQNGLPLTSQMLKQGKDARSAQFSPDGTRVVAASGHSARVWDVRNGQLLIEALEHDHDVQSAQFSPDGMRIVTASGFIHGSQSIPGTARVWDAQSGRPLTEPMKHAGAVHSARFSPDGRRIVTASDDTTAGVWDAQSGKPLAAPVQHDGEVHFAEFNPDGERIVTVSGSTVRVLDAQSGKPLTGPVKPDAYVHCAQFSPDGKQIVTASSNELGGTLRVWDANDGRPLTETVTARVHESFLSAQFSPDGKRMVTVRGDERGRPGTAEIWNAQQGRALTEPMRHGDTVESAQFSPDGKRILTVAGDQVRVWDAQICKALTEPMRHDDTVESAQFNLDGKRILSVSDGAVRIWDAQNGKMLVALLKGADRVHSAQFSPDGKRIVTLSRTAVRVWDTLSGSLLTEPMKHDAIVSAVQFSPYGKRIVTVSDGTVRVWDGLRGKLLVESSKQVDFRYAEEAQFSLDGRHIVTVCFDGTMRILNAQTCKLVEQEVSLRSPQFSPDGKRTVDVFEDGTAWIRDAHSGKHLTEPLKHDHGVSSAQFSPDGKRVVTASEDKTVRVWDIAPAGNPVPEWLLRLAEAVAGQQMNDQGVFEPLSAEPCQVLEEIRMQVSHLPLDDEWAVWGRWFLADRSTRTISPLSKITVPEYIENRINENTPASLDEAERLAAGNAELLQRVAHARKVPRDR